MNIDSKFHRDSIYEHRNSSTTDDSDYYLLDTSKDRPKFVCTPLIAWVWLIVFTINASYAICAPFLPWLAEDHNVDQKYLGIMFW